MNTGKVLLGVLAGVAAGALLGILFAPEKCAVTRRKIIRKSEDYGEDLKEKFDDLLETITGKIDSVRESAEEYAEKGKAKLDAVKAKNAMSEDGHQPHKYSK
jgi:gas vesicle protein